jgi:hypothetical protein
MSGQWPPEWEDSDTGLPDDWTTDDAGLDQEAGLDHEASHVTSILASVPSPVLPTAFVARISSAIAAEAAARANGTAQAGTGSAGTGSAGTGSAGTGSAGTESAAAGTESAGTELADAGLAAAGTDDAKTTDRSSRTEFSPAAAESGPATAAKHRRRRTAAGSRGAARKSGPMGSRPGGRRRRFRMLSPAVAGPLLVLLVIAGFALVFSQFGSSSSSSGLANGTAAVPAAGSASASAGPADDHAAPNGRFAGAGAQYETNLSGHGGEFVVTESGTRYQGTTLARQVREQLGAVSQNVVTPAATAPVPASSSSAVPASASGPSINAPPTALSGCVSRLTGGVTPSLVDRASYDGTPAYIIAVPRRVWVVRLGCTAADLQEITSVSLTGLSGNLNALGSVEGYASPGERHLH